MKIHVPDIPEEGLQQEADFRVTINRHARPDIVHAFLRILRFGKRVLIEGRGHVTVTVKCSRCLKEASLPLELAFREEYLPAEDHEKEGEQELTSKEMDLSFYRNDELDIAEIVKEQVLLTVPMKPLCRENCRGLCPVCGKDYNEGTCECRKEEVDPRLAPLSILKESMKERKE